MVKEVMFGVGEENPYGEFFVGKSYLNILTTEGVMVATFDMDKLAAFRKEVVTFRDRRPEMYKHLLTMGGKLVE